MSHDTPHLPVHPAGEQPPIEQDAALAPATLDTWAGPVRVEWDPTAPLTPYGQLPFFIEYLKVAGLFDALVADCPLAYTSPNAPEKRDVLGTTMLSVLAGHKRYAHITALRNDGVLPELLGMKKIVSEDAVRRGFKAIGEDEGREWLQRHLDYCTAPLLSEPWVLDMDSTVKPLYGHQEGAVLGYNPKKPGRPSHVYHTYTMAGLRLVLDVGGCARQRACIEACGAGLWALLDRIPRDCWPAFLRGDSGFGTEAVMSEAEQRGLPYLFKLRLTANVKKLIKKTFSKDDWTNAGQGWQGREDTLRLEGWSRQRQVVILRRRLKEGMAIAGRDDAGQLALGFVEIGPDAEVYEYGVLVTSLEEEVLTLAQLYRDRADSENPFDELKNQWGWAGFTTRDLARCQTHGPLHRARLQLVEPVRAPRRTGQTSGGHHQPAAAAVRHRGAQPPCQADHAEGGQLARQGWMGGERALGHRPLPSRAYSNCGAVDRGPALAPNPLPRRPVLARRAPVARSAASYGAGLTGKTHINRLSRRFEIARRRGQLPFLG